MSEDQEQLSEFDAPVRRRSSQKSSVYVGHVKRTRAILVAIFLLALAGGAAYYHLFQTAHFVVALENKPLLAVATQEQGDEVIRRIKAEYEPRVPQVVQFEEGTLTVQPYRGDLPVTRVNDAVGALRHKLTPYLQGEAIFVNGAPCVLMASRADAMHVLAFAQQRALERKKIKDGVPTFVQRVVVNTMKVQLDEKSRRVPVMTIDEAVEELTHPPRPRFHIVGRGDSFYVIASRRGLTVEIIKKLNPGVNPQALQPGDKVRLPDELAPLSVAVVKR